MSYVLWTRNGREENTRQMIHMYVDPALYSRCVIPYKLKRHYFGGSSKLVKLKLFPSYLFIETNNINEFINQIKWFPDFNVVLPSNDLYCPLQQHEEVMLFKFLDDHDIIDISKGRIENGKVHITDGPLVGQEDFIKKIKPRQGVAILEMNIFHRTTEVSLGLEIMGQTLK